jgi:hypothetical protein
MQVDTEKSTRHPAGLGFEVKTPPTVSTEPRLGIADGLWNLAFSGIRLDKMAATIKLRDQPRQDLLLQIDVTNKVANETSFAAVAGGVHVWFRWQVESYHLCRVQVVVRNLSSNDVVVESITVGQTGNVSDILSGDAVERVLINGADSWASTGLSRIPQEGKPTAGTVKSGRSQMVGVISNNSNTCSLLIGDDRRPEDGINPIFVTCTTPESDQPGSLLIEKDLHRTIQANEEVEAGGIVFATGDPPTALLGSYGDRMAKHLKPRIPNERTVGWSTWDYYLDSPSIDDVTDTINTIKSHPEQYPDLDRILIDAGWFNRVGDYRANIDFLSDRSKFVRAITDSGFKVGLWTMPLLVEPNTKLARTRTHLLIQDTNGCPLDVSSDEWGVTHYSLDLTVEEARQHLFNTFRDMQSDGVDYFKLDFLRQSLRFPDRPLSDPSINRYDMMRIALQIIRDAVGEKSGILACGSPIEPTVGLVDSLRVGNDVKGYWSNFQDCARSISHRFWMHRRLFEADPDYCIVRGPETADQSEDRKTLLPCPEETSFGWLSGTPALESEARVWATIQIIAGGPLVLSDHLGKLNNKGNALLSKIFSAHKAAKFIPLDLLDNASPCVWARLGSPSIDAGGKYDMVGLINWDDKPKCFDLKQLGVVKIGLENLWGGSLEPGASSIVVAPRDAALLRLAGGGNDGQ